MSKEHTYTLAGVMGWPITHSRSPVIHKHWFAEHGLRGDYVLLPVQAERLAEALRGLPALGFAGCNLTIPHKIAALALVDRVEPLAQRIGAVNTVVVEKDGSLTGRNTDAEGFMQSLHDAQPDWRADQAPAVVIGAGGAARAVIAGLLQHGATEVRVCNRTWDTALALQHEFGNAVRPVAWEQRGDALFESGLLVNTTNQGMQGQPPLDLALQYLPQGALVADIVYAPLQTPLLTAATEHGNPTVNGLGMLINQARLAFEAWTGALPANTAELRAQVLKTF
jgi:shikimate dehydrogenase